MSRVVPWLSFRGCRLPSCMPLRREVTVGGFAALQAATVAVSGKAGLAFWCAGTGTEGVRYGLHGGAGLASMHRLAEPDEGGSALIEARYCEVCAQTRHA